MKVAIYGYGFLGKAMYNLLHDRHEVFVEDPAYGRGIPLHFVPDIAFVCVPTPIGDEGNCDMSIVESVVRECQAKLIVIKSTVAPGTTGRLMAAYEKRVVFSPEYMGESKYYVPDQYLDPKDARKHGFMILGGALPYTSEVIDFFLPILGPTCRFRQMGALEAEIVKYAENSYFAMKVTFANLLRDICEEAGADYHTVREGWLDDPRVGPMHSAAFRDERGFGGKCLPKDTLALDAYCCELGIPNDLLEAVIKCNSRS